MGLGASKDEMVFVAAQKGDVRAIQQLRQQGASLEWTDPKQRTPLIVACSYPEGYDAAATLLQLGANLRAYRPGPEGGYPIHHAAKKGLDRTLSLLFQNGAEALVVNDLGQTPLQMARDRGNVTTVRLIEDKIALFSGTMRQQTVSAPGFIEAIASGWVFKKVWVVVLPANVDPRQPARFELVIYASAKAASPITSIPLEYAKLSIAKPESNDPVLLVEDTYAKAKFKLLGDKDTPNSSTQVQRLFNACRGIPQDSPPTGVPTWQAPQPYTLPTQTSTSQAPASPSIVSSSGYGNNATTGGSQRQDKFQEHEDVALKLAIEESLRMANQNPGQQGGSRANNYGGWGPEGTGSYGGWGDAVGGSPQQPQQATDQRPSPVTPAPIRRVPSGPQAGASPGSSSRRSDSGATDWLPTKDASSYNGWGPSRPSPTQAQSTTPTSRLSAASPASPAVPTPPSALASDAAPSAPPLPAQLASSIQYPSVNTTPVRAPIPVSLAAGSAPGPPAGGADQGGSKCVICWDNPAEAACIPCGHMAGCMQCLAEIKSKKWGCPVCRAPIKETIRVYQV